MCSTTLCVCALFVLLTQIGDAGLRALLAALASSQATLESLSLDQNQITAAGAALLGAWLAANKTLKYLRHAGGYSE